MKLISVDDTLDKCEWGYKISGDCHVAIGTYKLEISSIWLSIENEYSILYEEKVDELIIALQYWKKMKGR